MACLVPGAWFIAQPSIGDGAWLGLSDRWWFWTSIGVPIIQQVAVAVLWRAQLCHGLLTRMFGNAGFVVWGVIFFPLLVARPLLALGMAVADTGSLALPVPDAVAIAFGAAFLFPAVWTMHSVKKYFGFARALGGDHFFER